MPSSNKNMNKHDNNLQKHPKMLKEFLQEINTTTTTTTPSTFQTLLNADYLLPNRTNKSRKTTLNSFQKLIINAVKSLHRSASSSPPMTLSRSLSKRLVDTFSVKKKEKSKSKSMIKVKDILRWRSFRDIVVEEPTPLDYSLSCDNNDCDIIFWEDDDNNKTTVDSNNSNNSCELSCVESEFCFTMDELPCWWGNLFDEGKKCDQNNDDVVVTDYDIGTKEDNLSVIMEDEKEQHSPVSVLNSPFRDETSDQDHEFESSFDKSLANMERTKQSLLQSIQWLENLAGISEDDGEAEVVQDVEQDYEPRKERNSIDAKTKANLSRAMPKLIKEECIKDVEKQGQWSKFEEDRQELGVELEVQFLSDLVNEVVVDLFR